MDPNMKPLISVVIPTYNHAHFLERSIGSVLEQTYSNLEILVIDNNSTDNTKTVIENFNDQRIKYLTIDNQGVIAASRNLGIQASVGDWIAFLDSDDYWDEKKLETVFCSEIDIGLFDAVSHDELVVDNDSVVLRTLKYGPYSDDFYNEMLVGGNRCSTSAIVVRTSFLKEFNLKFDESRDFVTVEDYGLWLDMARLGAKFKFVPKVLGYYVMHPDNNSSKVKFHWDNCLNLLHYHLFHVNKVTNQTSNMWSAIRARVKIQTAAAYFGQRQYMKALQLLGVSVVTLPKGTVMFLCKRLARANDITNKSR